MMEIRDEFMNYVNQALEEMPVEFREKLDNVNIFVEDLPTREQLAKLGPGHSFCLDYTRAYLKQNVENTVLERFRTK